MRDDRPNVDFRTVDPSADEALWALRQYFAELDDRFPTGFDPGDALDGELELLRAPHGAFVLAETPSPTEPSVVGCGAVRCIDDGTFEIKRMWVSPAARGSGTGRRLLRHLEQTARAFGAARVVLDTNSVLLEAIALYESSGYTSIERYNDNPFAMRWFEKRLDI